jgi:hypothetical protein
VGKIDILFATNGRAEYTRESLEALKENTDWRLVRVLWIYLDHRSDEQTGAAVLQWLAAFAFRRPVQIIEHELDGPVAIMLDYFGRIAAGELVAKIDNDVIVPRGWLAAAARVMEARPELDILGLEPPLSRTAAPWAKGKRPAPPEWLPMTHRPGDGCPGYARADAIGGVGLMRRRAFTDREPMVPHSTYGGFTDWQQRHPDLVIGWIIPPISLFLLDRLPLEPWSTLSRKYIARGEQRGWTNYGPEAAELWEWWSPKP